MPIRRLAMESAIREIHSPPLVRAYLLLCIWSMPFGAVVDDPSWTYSGIATHKALHIGLHRPRYLQEFYENQPMDPESVRLLRMIWLTCFIANQRFETHSHDWPWANQMLCSLSARLGLPATVSPDHTILEALDDNGIPTAIRIRLELAYKELTFSNLLGHNRSAPDGLFPDPLPLIEAFDSELDQIEVRHSSFWNIASERGLLATKLRLYSYAIPRTEKANKESGQGWVATTTSVRHDTTRASISSCLAKSYSMALRLIEISSSAYPNKTGSSEGFDQTKQAHPNLVCFWTSWDSVDLILATFTLLQIIKRWHFNPEEVAATNAISRAWNLLSSCSVAEGDHFNRVCDIIEYVSKLEWPRDLSLKSEPTLSTRSRMGTSIQWDLIRRARRRYGNGMVKYDKQLAEPQSEVSPSNSSLNDLPDFPVMPDILPTLFDDVLWPTWDISLGANSFPLDMPQ